MIEVTNLSKRFGGLVAVDDLSFQVDAGQAVALWGANGAGKTTALRCLLGLIPFSGRVTITGRDVSKQGKAARRQPVGQIRCAQFGPFPLLGHRDHQRRGETGDLCEVARERAARAGQGAERQNAGAGRKLGDHEPGHRRWLARLWPADKNP